MKLPAVRTYEVTVPAEAMAGDLLATGLASAAGDELQILVPEGALPGANLTFELSEAFFWQQQQQEQGLPHLGGSPKADGPSSPNACPASPTNHPPPPRSSSSPLIQSSVPSSPAVRRSIGYGRGTVSPHVLTLVADAVAKARASSCRDSNTGHEGIGDEGIGTVAVAASEHQEQEEQGQRGGLRRQQQQHRPGDGASTGVAAESASETPSVTASSWGFFRTIGRLLEPVAAGFTESQQGSPVAPIRMELGSPMGFTPYNQPPLGSLSNSQPPLGSSSSEQELSEREVSAAHRSRINIERIRQSPRRFASASGERSEADYSGAPLWT